MRTPEYGVYLISNHTGNGFQILGARLAVPLNLYARHGPCYIPATREILHDEHVIIMDGPL